MTYFQIDDASFEHPRMMDLTPDDWCLWVHCLGYCSRNLTDGFVPDRIMRTMSPVADPDQTSAHLVKVGRLRKASGGFEVVGYGDHNRLAAEIREQRSAATERKRRSRERHADVTRDSRVTERDMSRVSHSGVTRPESESESELKNTSSSESDLRGLSTGPDDDDGANRRRKAARLIAVRRASRRDDLKNPGGWIARTAKSLDSGDDAEVLDAAMAANPNATAAELAEIVEPEPAQQQASSPASREPDPTCDECAEHHGWVFLADGVARCTHPTSTDTPLGVRLTAV